MCISSNAIGRRCLKVLRLKGRIWEAATAATGQEAKSDATARIPRDRTFEIPI